MFFSLFTDDMFDQMINKILKLAYQEENEIVSILAIKCMQVAAHGSERIMNHKKNLSKYLSWITFRILNNYNEISSEYFEDMTLSDKSFFVPKKLKKHLETFIYQDQIIAFVLINHLSCESKDLERTKLFHMMASIGTIIMHYQINEILSQFQITDVIYACIHSNHRKNDGVVGMAVQILIDIVLKIPPNYYFMIEWYFGHVFTIQYSLVCSQDVLRLISKIIPNHGLFEHLIGVHDNFVEIMTCYVINYAPQYYAKIYKEVIRIFVGNEKCYSELRKQNGLRSIIINMKNSDYYRRVTNDVTSFLDLIHHGFSFDSLDTINEMPEIVCVCLAREVMFHLHKEKLVHIPSNVPIDLDLCEELCDIVGREDIYQRITPIFEELCDSEVSEILYVVTKYMYAGLQSNDLEKFEIYFRDVRMYWLYVMRFILLSRNFGKLLTEKYSLYPDMGNDSDSFIFLFKSMWNCFEFFEKTIELPTEPFKNILLSCFPSSEAARKFIDTDNTIFDNERNENDRMISIIKDPMSIKILDYYYNNSYEHLFWDTIFNKNNLILTNQTMIDSIQCLIMMTSSENFTDSVSKMNETHRKLCSKMLQRYCSSSTDESCYVLYKIAKRLMIKSVTYKHEKEFGGIIENCNEKRTENIIALTEKYVTKLFEKPKSSRRSDTYISRKTSLRYGELSDHDPCLMNDYIYGTWNKNIYPDSVKKLHKHRFKRFNSQIKYTFNETAPYRVKFLFDDKILVTLYEGFTILDGKKALLIEDDNIDKVMNIEESKCGQYILFSGNKYGFFTRLNRRNFDNENTPLLVTLDIPNISLSKFMNNDKFIYGMDRDFQIEIYDLETSQCMQKVGNKSPTGYSTLNILDINNEDTIMLSNGDLFCTRSSKMIHQFPHLNQRVSGIFSPSFTEVIMHTEIYDLRTLRLREQIPNFKNIFIKRTYDDNLLAGQPIKIQSQVSYPTREVLNSAYHPWHFGMSAYIYDSKTYSTIFNYSPGNWVKFFDMNRSATSFCVGESKDRHLEVDRFLKISEERKKIIVEMLIIYRMKWRRIYKQTSAMKKQ
ncbi:Protein VPRBP [Thelohanellus kitauei]|uniref:Protein VPRBP n=1 Tax=Thelohanellus kitauei TaxID=669202 RepID=A0A0C2J3E0_THEKT|nr:Protein VPRBP [Thelohanellus kitauei]